MGAESGEGPLWVDHPRRRGELRRLVWLAVSVSLLPSTRITAQEFYALYGGQHTQGLDESTYSYSFEYLHNVNEHLVASFTWLNEGHVTNHHRDGHSAQLWYRWLSAERRFTLAVGVGPYRYYDTTETEAQENSTDAHGWGAMGSIAAHWYFHYPWVLQLRYNYTYTSSSITTQTYQFGFGYQFDPSPRSGPVVPQRSTASPFLSGAKSQRRSARASPTTFIPRRESPGRSNTATACHLTSTSPELGSTRAIPASSSAKGRPQKYGSCASSSITVLR